jgi:hypothetical protein
VVVVRVLPLELVLAFLALLVTETFRLAAVAAAVTVGAHVEEEG